AFRASRQNKIYGAIVVEIGSDHASASGFGTEGGFGGNISECAVAIVAPHHIARRVSRLIGDVKIEIAVVIVVNEGHTNATFFAANVNRFGYVGKFSCAIVVKEAHAIAHADGLLRFALIVKSAHSAAYPASLKR